MPGQRSAGAQDPEYDSRIALRLLSCFASPQGPLPDSGDTSYKMCSGTPSATRTTEPSPSPTRLPATDTPIPPTSTPEPTPTPQLLEVVAELDGSIGPVYSLSWSRMELIWLQATAFITIALSMGRFLSWNPPLTHRVSGLSLVNLSIHPSLISSQQIHSYG